MRWGRGAVCLLAWCAAAPAWAVQWDGGGTTSSWMEAANWQFNAIPTTADTATIVSDTATIAGQTVPGVMAVELGMGSFSGGLTMTGNVNPSVLNVATSVTVAPAGQLTLGGGGPATSTINAASLTTGGTVTIHQRGIVDLSGSLTQTSGTLNLNGGAIDATSVSMQAGTFNARGSIDANVTIGNGSGATAMLAPDRSLEIAGSLKFASDARLEVSFGSSGFDQIEVLGTATLGGVLDLSLLSGATPTPGVVYPLISARAIDGAFKDITGSDAGGGSWIPDFDITNGINVFYTELRGNMNGDDTVDELDAALFAHAIRDPNTYHFDYYLEGNVADAFMADMDGDGSNTFADIPAFLQVIENLGGDSSAAIAAITHALAVPEPAAATMLAIGVLLTSARRRTSRARG